MQKLRELIRISEAAEYLGVSPNTIRNWQNVGKVVAVHHPVSGYRLCSRKVFDAIRSWPEAVTGGPSRR